MIFLGFILDQLLARIGRQATCRRRFRSHWPDLAGPVDDVGDTGSLA
jgi:hypothetical protein